MESPHFWLANKELETKWQGSTLHVAAARGFDKNSSAKLQCLVKNCNASGLAVDRRLSTGPAS